MAQEDVVDEPRRAPAPLPSEAPVFMPLVDSSPVGTPPDGEDLESSGAEIAARALELATAGSAPPAGVADLLFLAGPHRRPLEEAHFVLVQRLHRRSDDFAATMALAMVSAVLRNVGRQHGTLPELARKRRRGGVVALRFRMPWRRRP